jgi:transposase-like protein
MASYLRSSIVKATVLSRFLLVRRIGIRLPSTSTAPWVINWLAIRGRSAVSSMTRSLSDGCDCLNQSGMYRALGPGPRCISCLQPLVSGRSFSHRNKGAGDRRGPGKIVEVDETFVGGKTRGKGLKAARDAKVKVLGIAERGGRIHLQTIENTKSRPLRPLLESKLDPETEKVVADGAAAYSHAIPKDKHEERAHKTELRDDGFITGTRHIESAFSLFKRGLVGSYQDEQRSHGQLSIGVLLAIQSPPHAAISVRHSLA